MTTARRRSALTVAGLAGVVVGAALAFLASDLSADDPTASDASTTSTTTIDRDAGTADEDDHTSPPSTVTDTTEPASGPPAVLLAWTSGGLPGGFSAAARQLPHAEDATVVRGGQADLLGSTGDDGSPVDVVEPGWAIPIDAIGVEPTSFATFAQGSDRRTIESLRPGTAILTRSSAALRRLGAGATLDMRGGTLTVTGIVDDDTGAGAELLVHAEDAARLGVATERYLLVGYERGARAALTDALAEIARPRPVRFRTPAETTWLRHGDAVVPQVFVKQAFGEFAYRDLEGRAVEIDPAWIEENIVTTAVPLLGDVRCHREMIEPLSGVLGELATMNLGHLVDPDGYAGCWVPRRIAEGYPLSRHSWGVAVDLNIGTNPRGSFSTQDPRLVDLMRSAGLIWGGTWLVPDPGHYELEAPE